MVESKTKANVSRSAATFFKAESSGFRIFDHTQYCDYLGELYQSIKESEPTYSYFQFANDLGFPKTNVIWLVITGRRRLSPSATDRVIQALKLKHARRRYFQTMVKHNNANKTGERDRLLSEMIDIKASVIQEGDDRHRLEYFSQWYYPVIREMVGLEDFRSDPQWIAEQLFMKVMPKQAQHALELLERLDLIRWDEQAGRHVQTVGQIRPTRAVGSIAAVRYHEKMCEIAKESVTRVPAKFRDLNALTVRLKEEDADLLRKKLLEVCELAFQLESSAKDSDSDNIYQINTQIFSLLMPKK